jgi:tetratricopeptide (TPR) repeat protein
MNWDNLSSIYRSLIGFGQNADQFAILANQQAIALDPSNPQEYINLGGIYYQLGQWDDAIRQFQLAANLKRDYANAYYNLGHALESKGGTVNLQGALQAYKIVEQLVSSDAQNVKRIKAEIEAVTKKISGGQQSQADQAANQSAEQTDLNVNDAPTLPGRDPKVEVEGPPASKISPTPTPTTSLEPAPSL